MPMEEPVVEMEERREERDLECGKKSLMSESGIEGERVAGE